MKILWDFTIQTDRETNHRRPGITVHDENKNKVLIIDIAVPGDNYVESREREREGGRERERNGKNIRT